MFNKLIQHFAKKHQDKPIVISATRTPNVSPLDKPTVMPDPSGAYLNTMLNKIKQDGSSIKVTDEHGTYLLKYTNGELTKVPLDN